MNRRTVWIICLLVILLGMISAAYRLMMPHSFDLVRWQQADDPSEYLDRRAMMPEVDHMIADGTIHSRESTLHYLGKPQRGDLHTSKNWFYNLGGQRSAESAPEEITWLELTFDSAGDITRHRTIQEQPPNDQPVQ